ncbi:MAG: sensor histidine kinase [Actinomycetota bacterium]
MTEAIWFTAGAAAAALVLGLVWFSRRARPAREPAAAPKLPEDPHGRELLDHIAEGVVLLDSHLKLTMANEAALRLLGLPRDRLPDRVPSEEVLAVARSSWLEGAPLDRVVETWFPARRSLRVHVAPLRRAAGLVLVLTDVTGEAATLRMRREFVAHASHELKSPVASIQTLAETIRGAVEDDATSAQRFAARLSLEATRLGHLISDLLDLSRLEHPQELPDERVDMAELARRELAQIAPEARSRQMTITSDAGSEAWVRGDPQPLGTMIRNLLENAVRYTPNGGTITLTVLPEPGRVVVVVTDTGIGIPREDQGRIFERFYRVDKARSRASGGTGLGLAIVKHVVELHGGSIAVDSEMGRGSTFTARLPAASMKRRHLRSAG